MSLVFLYFLITTIYWRIQVEGDMVTIYKPFRKTIQADIQEISGVDIKNETYTLLHGTKALTKAKLADRNLHVLMQRLGVNKFR
jgi:hypothetical protein